MDMIHDNAAGPIGKTPLVRLNKISKDLGVTIAVKLEYMNPTCSVKDRAASAMIEDAEKKGLIHPSRTVLVEATSGNMGIALAFYAQLKGYKIVLLMPESASTERRALMAAYGATLIITPSTLMGKALTDRAKEVAESDSRFFWLNQFGNKANSDMHYRTTGPEIWSQTKGKVDIVVFGVGSGGTVSGVGRYLKEQNNEVKVHAVEPYESSVISGHEHTPHKIQGIGAGFVPAILERTWLEDPIIRVTSEDAIAMARRLATEEGILGGISSGANVCAAIELAKKPENKGKLIVTSINSFGERYLSTVLYKGTMDAAAAVTPTANLAESIAIAKTVHPIPA